MGRKDIGIRKSEFSGKDSVALGTEHLLHIQTLSFQSYKVIFQTLVTRYFMEFIVWNIIVYDIRLQR